MNAALAAGFVSPAVCLECGDAILDGNTCIECWRDRRDLAAERDREWWS